MGSTVDADGLGNQILLDKIDRLRELNVGNLVSLPQLIVVGDQSSGKSSVLESLTGFSFPRAAGLCTRYATQITCRRESQPSVSISIIPRPNATDAVKQKLRRFHRHVDIIDGQDLADVFEDANDAMGIRSRADTSEDEDDDSITFSEDILKIEINGPDQPALTVIDVPGIFRTATPGLTTESDIALVTAMVKSYMKDPRTIILAVIPCNVDIATQEILKLAKDADPNGSRTMGVLTKPDLAPERAMQQNVLDLIQGRRQDLKLGYCVVKNRGADDQDSSLKARNDKEKAFFRDDPWSGIASSGRVGIAALKVRLRELLMDISKREFPTVKAEITKKLVDCRKKFDAMGASRADEKAQRAYLASFAEEFVKIVSYSLNAYYTEDPIFITQPKMTLITRILELNEVFSRTFSERGHARHFDHLCESYEEKYAREYIEDNGVNTPDGPEEVKYELPSEINSDLVDIILAERFDCPEPSDESIMDHIEDVFRKNRGPELGTYGGYLLGMIFKEQSKRWEDILLSHISDVIIIVHDYILGLLNYLIPEKQVLEELWENLLLEKLQASYKRAMDHARFLLRIEREGKPITFNDDFSVEVQRAQADRLRESLEDQTFKTEKYGEVVMVGVLRTMSINKSNPQEIREKLHDNLESYYKISVKRFVDVVCQQVVDHHLLNGKDSPLHVFSTKLVLDLNAGALEMIAGEDHVTKQERERLSREIDSLQNAMKVLRA